MVYPFNFWICEAEAHNCTRYCKMEYYRFRRYYRHFAIMFTKMMMASVKLNVHNFFVSAFLVDFVLQITIFFSTYDLLLTTSTKYDRRKNIAHFVPNLMSVVSRAMRSVYLNSITVSLVRLSNQKK